MEMFGSGVKILGIIITMEHPQIVVHGLIMIIVLKVCCAVVLGSAILKSAVLPTASGAIPTSGTMTTVFVGLFALFPPELFCARVGVWECVERAEEESRPVPVMLVTVSEYQIGSSSLVGINRRLARPLKLFYSWLYICDS